MAVQESKKWAEGLDQVEFERKWMQKFPGSDVIPLGEEWIHRPLLRTHGIDSLPASHEHEPDKFVPEPIEPVVVDTEPLKVIKDIKDVKVVKKEKESGKDFIPKLSKQSPSKNN